MIVVLLFVYLAAAIFAALLINKKFVSKFEENMKKTMRVVTFIICIVTALGEFAVSSVRKWTFAAIDRGAVTIERVIAEHNPGNQFIQEGIDVSFLDQALLELQSLMPETIAEDGEMLSETINTAYIKFTGIAFAELENKKKLITKYAEGNIVTLSSVINALKHSVFSSLNWIYGRWHLYVLAILIVYIAYCAYTAHEGKKYYQSGILFGEGSEGVEQGMSGKEK